MPLSEERAQAVLSADLRLSGTKPLLDSHSIGYSHGQSSSSGSSRRAFLGKALNRQTEVVPPVQRPSQ